MDTVITGISRASDSGGLSSEAILSSMQQILKESRFNSDEKSCWNRGIFLGTTLANFAIRDNNIKNYFQKGPRAVNPTEFPQGLISYLGGYFSIKCNIRGINSTVSSGFSSGIDALSHATYFIERNRKNKALVVELAERMVGDKVCQIPASCCFVVGHPDSFVAGSQAQILALRSFFEKDGDNRGLVKAVGEALAVCSLDASRLDYIYTQYPADSSDYRMVVGALGPYLKGKQALVYSGDCEKGSGGPGLIALADMVKKNFVYNPKPKKNTLAMFLHLGSVANSSCIILKLPAQKEVD